MSEHGILKKNDRKIYFSSGFVSIDWVGPLDGFPENQNGPRVPEDPPVPPQQPGAKKFPIKACSLMFAFMTRELPWESGTFPAISFFQNLLSL